MCLFPQMQRVVLLLPFLFLGEQGKMCHYKYLCMGVKQCVNIPYKEWDSFFLKSNQTAKSFYVHIRCFLSFTVPPWFH